MSTVDLRLEEDTKLAIILNGLPEWYQYFVVNMEKQEKINFDELVTRLLKEEKKVDSEAKIEWSVLLSKTQKAEGDCHHCGQ